MKIINVMAASIDGKIGASSLESDRRRREYGFTNRDDQEFVRKQIQQADAIITGANSMRASGGAWVQKGRGDRYPLWVVVTNAGLDKDLRFWQQAETPRWIVSKNPLPMHASPVKNITYGPHSAAAVIHSQLANAGMEVVLLFGGGFINQLFYQENLVDELKLTLCPIIIGSEMAPQLVMPPLANPKSFRLLSSQPVGSHVFLHYEVIKS